MTKLNSFKATLSIFQSVLILIQYRTDYYYMYTVIYRPTLQVR